MSLREGAGKTARLHWLLIHAFYAGEGVKATVWGASGRVPRSLIHALHAGEGVKATVHWLRRPFVIEPAAGSGPNRSSKGTDLRVPSQLDRAVHRPQGD